MSGKKKYNPHDHSTRLHYDVYRVDSTPGGDEVTHLGAHAREVDAITQADAYAALDRHFLESNFAPDYYFNYTKYIVRARPQKEHTIYKVTHKQFEKQDANVYPDVGEADTFKDIFPDLPDFSTEDK